jgi:hypothetical protein
MRAKVSEIYTASIYRLENFNPEDEGEHISL